MEKLFSYGTLQQKNVQLETFGRILTGERDTLCRYELGEVKIQSSSVVAKSGKSIHPVLYFTDQETDQVEGTIYEITAEELLMADAYEVEEYKRVQEVFASGTNAWVYVSAVEGKMAWHGTSDFQF